MRITLKSILVVSTMAILASISVTFYSSVIAQNFEMYTSEEENESLDDEDLGELSVQNEGTNNENPTLVPTEFDYNEDQIFAPLIYD